MFINTLLVFVCFTPDTRKMGGFCLFSFAFSLLFTSSGELADNGLVNLRMPPVQGMAEVEPLKTSSGRCTLK